MTTLKVIGILVGAWVVLGVAFIGPAQQMPRGAGAAFTLAGVVAVGIGAYFAIRRVVKRSRREDTQHTPRV